MGVYSGNRFQFGGIDPDTVYANESYDGEIGAQMILAENAENDMAIFEAVLGNDFQTVIAMQEGTLLESEVTIITEGSLGDFYQKIKTFLTKVWEKIKGLFKSFMVKLNGIVIRDNKKFVEKYKAEVLKKPSLSKMKYKWSKPTGNSISPQGVPYRNGLETAATEEAIRKYVEDKIDSGDLMEEILAKTIGGKKVEVGEYTKEAHSYQYDDEDTEEGLGGSMLTEIMNTLVSGGNTLKALTKTQTDADKLFSNLVNDIEKDRNTILKPMPEADKTDSEKNARSTSIARANALYQVMQVYASASTKATSASIEGAKYGIKQARRVFAQAAAYNAKKEDAVFVEAAGEAAEYEVDSNFACFS